MKRFLYTTFWLLVTTYVVGATDVRLVALGALETGGNDYAHGSKGEVSQYQIMPEVWQQYSPNCELWSNTAYARRVAGRIMCDRIQAFQHEYHRPPSNFEWALLWHCPGRVEHPTHNDADYAVRFLNLYQRFSN